MTAIAALVGGAVRGDGTVRVDRVVADSREAVPGALFVALPGERADGHDFVAEAAARGASAALLARDGRWPVPAVVVSHPGAALLDLAADERRAMGAAVVGITGSSGKTCTKDFTAAVLSIARRTHASPRSFNTEVGVPVTILGAPDGTETLVLEMGSRGIGHVAALCAVARPDVGVVTNVGPAHLATFGSRENVARAKAELVEALPQSGVAVLNADDPVVAGFASVSRARVVTYGVGGHADVRAEDVSLDEGARAAFTLAADGGAERVELTVPGEHMVPNALAAAAAGLALGLGLGECAAGLKDARVSAWRMEVVEARGGFRILNDAYNANPASTAAALKAARWMARERRCVAVLGEMAELGDTAYEEHERLGETVARLGIEELVTVGERGRTIARGAIREGVEEDHVTMCADGQEALAAVRRIVRPGDVVLVKASRVAGLEWLAGALARRGAG